MIRLTLTWGVLLLAGTSMVEIYATPSVTAPVQSTSKASESLNNITQATPITTAQANKTTETTHVPTNTTETTHVPTNTTSHAPFNTTTQPATHTTPVLPTKPSPPPSGHYTVKDSNKTCIIADMGLALELSNSTTLMQARESKAKWYFNVNSKETHASGTCGDTKANLKLQFPEGSIHFVFVKESKIYYIDEISVNFSWSSEHWNGTDGKLKLLSTDVGYAVKCKNTPTVKMASNLQLTMADVTLQAFDIRNDTRGKEDVCYPDRKKMLVPVGIALAVVGLILIILLVVLLTRRRRSSGYQRI